MSHSSIHCTSIAARSSASRAAGSSEEGVGEAVESLGAGLADRALELGRNVLGSPTDGLPMTDTTAADIGPPAELAVHPAARMSTPSEKAPARKCLPTVNF